MAEHWYEKVWHDHEEGVPESDEVKAARTQRLLEDGTIEAYDRLADAIIDVAQRFGREMATVDKETTLPSIMHMRLCDAQSAHTLYEYCVARLIQRAAQGEDIEGFTCPYKDTDG